MPPRNPTFGLTSSGRGRGRGRGGGGSNTRFTGNKRGSWQKRGGGGGGDGKNAGEVVLDRGDDGNAAAEKFEEVRIKDEIDEKMGFWRWEGGGAGGAVDGSGDEKVGWLVNMHQVRLFCSEELDLLQEWRKGEWGQKQGKTEII
jgi:DNA polymerase epsilon subunit 1